MIEWRTGMGMSDPAMYYLCIFYVVAGRPFRPRHRDLKFQGEKMI